MAWIMIDRDGLVTAKSYPRPVGDDWIEVSDDVTPGMVRRADGRFEAPAPSPPPPIRVIKPNAFIRRIPQPRRLEIRAASNPVIDDLFDLIRTSDGIDLDDEEVTGGVAYMVAQNLITDVEAARLTADGTPKEAA